MRLKRRYNLTRPEGTFKKKVSIKDSTGKALTGRHQKQAEDAATLLEKAVGDAARQAKSLASRPGSGYNEKTKYSAKASRGRSIEPETLENKGSDDYTLRKLLEDNERLRERAAIL